MGSIGRSMPESNNCYVCDKLLPPFLITPVIETANGLVECCETCADREFPGWREEDKEEMGED